MEHLWNSGSATKISRASSFILSFSGGSQKSTSSKSSYGSTEADYYYTLPEYGDFGSLKKKPLDIIKENDTDWSSDTGSGQEVIKLEMVKKTICNILDAWVIWGSKCMIESDKKKMVSSPT